MPWPIADPKLILTPLLSGYNEPTVILMPLLNVAFTEVLQTKVSPMGTVALMGKNPEAVIVTKKTTS